MLQHAQALAGYRDEEQTAPRYQLAIPVDQNDGRASSDARARVFIQAAAAQGSAKPRSWRLGHRGLPGLTPWLRAETARWAITPFELARRAEQLKMPVTTAPAPSLARSNKLYLYELMGAQRRRHAPARMVATRRVPPARGRAGAAPGLPPDGEGCPMTALQGAGSRHGQR